MVGFDVWIWVVLLWFFVLTSGASLWGYVGVLLVLGCFWFVRCGLDDVVFGCLLDSAGVLGLFWWGV